ncbi:MAG TPA: hypothetical protein VE130_04565 [Nitrososphaeraceae archaeon]|nr:hypothetical protein [Nitrososphaeraceae archaeon]
MVSSSIFNQSGKINISHTEFLWVLFAYTYRQNDDPLRYDKIAESAFFGANNLTVFILHVKGEDDTD